MASNDIDKCDEFWFDDGNLVLLVDNVYFKPHRSLLCKHSAVFRDMIQVSGSGERDGTLAQPVHVPDVSWRAFTNLLRFLYGPAHSSVAMEDAALVAVIRAAHRLQMDQITFITAQLAMDRLPALSCLELCQGLALDDIRRRQVVAEHDARLARQDQDNQREQARSSCTSLKEVNTPVKADVASRQKSALAEFFNALLTQNSVADTNKRKIIEHNKWLVRAFVDTVLDFCTIPPGTDPECLLDAEMRWLIASTRQTISSARAQKIFSTNDSFMTSSTNRYHPRDIANIASVLPFVARAAFGAEVGKRAAITLNTQQKNSPQFVDNQLSRVGMSQADLENWVPSEVEEVKTVEDAWFTSRSKSTSL